MDLKNHVIKLLDPPNGFQNWHGGPTLMGSLRCVDHNQAAWKPFPDRHCIWELALHIAYWNYSVRRYLDPAAEKGFARSPANWPGVETVTRKAWEKDKILIKNQHLNLIEAIEAFSAGKMDRKISSKKKWTYGQLIMGAAVHDTYHIGQIQLMKRLYKE